MIGDQLTYLEARFYNSNCSKPNGSASPFGEAQLDDTKLRSVATALRFRRNVQRASVGGSNSDAFGDSSEQETPAPSNAGNLVPTTASDRLKPVVPNPQAIEKCEDHFNTYGRRYLL